MCHNGISRNREEVRPEAYVRVGGCTSSDKKLELATVDDFTTSDLVTQWVSPHHIVQALPHAEGGILPV